MGVGLGRVFFLGTSDLKTDLARSSSTLLLWLLSFKPALFSRSSSSLLGMSSALASSWTLITPTPDHLQTFRASSRPSG